MSKNIINTFICYETTTGLGYAKNLRDALTRMHMSAFVAKEDIKKGEQPQEIIDEAIKGCEYFLVIITYPAINSEDVKREVTLADSLNKVIIPCKEKNVDRSWLSELPVISELQQIDFENREELANDVISEIKERETLKAIERGAIKATFESIPSVIRNIQNLLSQIGQSIKGKKVGLIGYGTNGREIAEEAKNYGAVVSISDTDPIKLLSARYKGYDADSILDLVGDSDLIIAATGKKSIGRAEILKLKNNAILASASFKSVEIDVEELENLCTAKNATEIGTWYVLVNGNTVLLLETEFPQDSILQIIKERFIH
jgi:5,10-methylene-tetrahydrofolate dehydrogenase/methenyl tetrahydrofolate cyclohydrolase